MRWAVYVDLSRALTDQEQGLVFAAVDEIVPGSGCVGPNAAGASEIYFSLIAGSTTEAEAEATSHVESVLGRAGVKVFYVIDAQPFPPLA